MNLDEFGYLQLKTRHLTILLDKLTEEQNLGHQVNVIRRSLMFKFRETLVKIRKFSHVLLARFWCYLSTRSYVSTALLIFWL